MSDASRALLRPGAMRLLLLAAGVVAIVVRVAFLTDKPFWRDEAWVASLVGGPPTVVVREERPRPVPVGFLALTNLMARLPGLDPQVAFRLIPLLVGLATLPALARLGTALGAGPPAVVIAVWLAAGMPALVYYSRELKPYGFDALIAVLAPLLALRILGRAADAAAHPPGIPAYVGLTLVLGATPWLSFGGTFPVVAMLAWGWTWWWRAAPPGGRRAWLAASVAFAGSFAAACSLGLVRQAASPSLHAAWRGALFSDHSGWALLAQAPDALARYFSISTTYLFPIGWPVAVGSAIVGLATWPRSLRGFVAWLVAGPAVCTVAAALADRYLLAQGRLLLFAAPPLILVVAAGASRLGERAAGRAGVATAIGLAMATAAFWSASAIAHRLPPYRNDVAAYFLYDVLHDVDAVTTQAVTLVSPAEPLLISVYSSKPFAYYGRGRLKWATMCLEPCPSYTDVVLPAFLRGIERRGWLLLIDEEAALHAAAAAQAGLTRTLRASARGVQLWELTRDAPHPS